MFLSVSPAYEEGRIVGAASIARDNTEHKRLEELSRLYTKRLELIHEMDQKSFSTRRVANARNSLSAIWSRWLVCRA